MIKTSSYYKKIDLRLKKYLFPSLRKLKLLEISPHIILNLLRSIENARKFETAHEVKNTVSQIFRYAIATQRAENDPTLALRGFLASPKVEHYAAIINPDEIAALRRMGYGNDQMTAHGFRAAYNHADFLPERRKMMQWWADWLDERRGIS